MADLGELAGADHRDGSSNNMSLLQVLSDLMHGGTQMRPGICRWIGQDTARRTEVGESW